MSWIVDGGVSAAELAGLAGEVARSTSGSSGLTSMEGGIGGTLTEVDPFIGDLVTDFATDLAGETASLGFDPSAAYEDVESFAGGASTSFAVSTFAPNTSSCLPPSDSRFSASLFSFSTIQSGFSSPLLGVELALATGAFAPFPIDHLDETFPVPTESRSDRSF